MALKFQVASTTNNLWFLVPVVIELQSCPAVRAVEITELMVPAHMSFLASGTSTVVCSPQEDKGRFRWACLTLPTQHDTGARRLHPRSLTNILKMDQSWIGDTQLYPPIPLLVFLPSSNKTGSEKAVRGLLEHLDDQRYTAYATTLTFRSAVVDRYLKQFVGSNETSSTFSQILTNTTSIMHCGALLPLEASALASNSTIHLITGVRVYIVYPPTLHNMMTVHKYFLDLTQHFTPKHANVCNDLQEGIAIVQHAGQTVTIPPFCPTTVFSTTISAGFTIRSRCQDDLSMRLLHLDLMVAQVKAVQYVYQETANTSLEYHTTQLYKEFSTFLRASEPSTPSLRLTLALGAAWREKGTRFRALVEEYVSKPSREQIRKNVPRLWNLAVRNQGLEECPVCNVNIKDLGVAFGAHFQKEHWNQAEDGDL
ncbi:hypothetical protein G6011_06992 [Alternaria panax]|uniref:Uncharacterized protein n=1 Tax=Alternaria panax TaxID=48097 RepID=A0AAD4F9T2_9PLEO|nr:hypothetical protein G6011_06992 [Alternaria panax]